MPSARPATTWSKGLNSGRSLSTWRNNSLGSIRFIGFANDYTNVYPPSAAFLKVLLVRNSLLR